MTAINPREKRSVRDVLTKSFSSTQNLLRVNDSTISTNKLGISAEAVSITAIASGTGTASLEFAPIYDSLGVFLSSGTTDTSFSISSGTALSREVSWRNDLDDGGQIALLSAGEYAIDYDSGKIRYAKDTGNTDSSITVQYTTRQLNTEITAGSVTMSQNVKQWDGNLVSLNTGAADAGTLRVALGTGGNLAVISDPDGSTVTTATTTSGTALNVRIASGTITADLTATDDSVQIYGYDTEAGGIQAIETTTVGAVEIDLLSLGSGTAISSGSGVAEAGTLRVVNADDDLNLAAINTNTTIIKSAFVDDGATFTEGSGTVGLIGGFYNSAVTNLSSGSAGVVSLTQERRLNVRAEGYDTGTDSNKVFEVSPINQAYSVDTLVDAGGTVGSFFVDMQGYKQLTLQFMTMTDTEARLFASVDPDEAGADTGDYVDISTAYLSAGTVPADENSMVIIDNGSAFKWIKVTLTDDGGGSMAHTIHSMKNY